MKPGKLQRNKDHKMYLGRSATVHNPGFCFVLTQLHMLGSSVTNNHDLLCFVHGQGQKKRRTKTLNKVFCNLGNHLPQLTMLQPSRDSLITKK